MLRAIYPEHKWDPLEFNVPPKGLRADPDSLRSVLTRIETELHIDTPSKWYEVSTTDLAKLGFLYLFEKSGGIFNVLRRHRSDFNWEEEKFLGLRHSGNRALLIALRSIWPTLEIKVDQRISSKGSPIETDEPGACLLSAFLPDLNLGFLYLNHSKIFHNTRKEPEFPFDLFELKESSSNSNKVRLVVVPFWWDRSPQSLAASVIQSFPSIRETIWPQLTLENAQPIPKEWHKRAQS